jgi:hypothetical protein
MVCSAKCALPGPAKNVTAVTMSQGFVTRSAWGGHAVTNLYVTAVTYLCEPGPVSWVVHTAEGRVLWPWHITSRLLKTVLSAP